MAEKEDSEPSAGDVGSVLSSKHQSDTQTSNLVVGDGGSVGISRALELLVLTQRRRTYGQECQKVRVDFRFVFASELQNIREHLSDLLSGQVSLTERGHGKVGVEEREHIDGAINVRHVLGITGAN